MTKDTGTTSPQHGVRSDAVFSITASALSKRFNREWIFRNLDHQFLGNNCYVIVGPNGSGKSTLLHTLASMIPPTSGTINYQQANHDIELDDVYRHISFAAPYMDLIEEFTLLEQVNFHFKFKRSRYGDARALIERMYLEKSEDKTIRNFSSGMKQRLKLGLAFYAETPVLLLDEPGTNLDKQAFAWYKQELASVPRNTLVLMASNDTEEYPDGCKLIDITRFKK